MKLLDELRLEKEITRHRQPERPARQPQAQPACDPLRQAMMVLYPQLGALARGLNELASEVPLEFDVPSMGSLDALHPRAFSLTMVDPALPLFEFSYHYVGRRGMSRILDTRSQYDALVARLKALDLAVVPDSGPTIRHVVRLKPEVPVRLSFSPTSDGREVQLSARNLGRLGRDLFSINPAEVTEALVEELGRLILGRRNRFLELTGNALSTEALTRLRERLGERAHSRARAAPAHLSAADAVHRHTTPRRAPLLVNEHSEQPKSFAWNDSDASPVSTTNGSSPPVYAWVVTCDLTNPDTTEAMARRGPPGTSLNFPTTRVVADGTDFRLTGTDGKVRFTGMILGTYRGNEPLVEFGIRHDCSAIEYLGERGWAPQRTTL